MNNVQEYIEDRLNRLLEFLQELDSDPFLNEVPDVRETVINELSDHEAPLTVQNLVEEINGILEELHGEYHSEAEFWVGLLLESDFVKDVEDPDDGDDFMRIYTTAGTFNVPRQIDSSDDEEEEGELEDDVEASDDE